MTGNYPDALGYLIKANELTPNVPKIKNNLAMAYFFKIDLIPQLKFLRVKS